MGVPACIVIQQPQAGSQHYRCCRRHVLDHQVWSWGLCSQKMTTWQAISVAVVHLTFSGYSNTERKFPAADLEVMISVCMFAGLHIEPNRNKAWKVFPKVSSLALQFPPLSKGNIQTIWKAQVLEMALWKAWRLVFHGCKFVFTCYQYLLGIFICCELCFGLQKGRWECLQILCMICIKPMQIYKKKPMWWWQQREQEDAVLNCSSKKK